MYVQWTQKSHRAVLNSPFHGWFFSFALQCYPTWMRGNFGLKLQNSPKLPHIHARFHCNANEQSYREKGYWVSKVIWNCFGFASLRSVIGLKYSHDRLNQSDAKPKPILTWSHAFSRAWHQLCVFASSSRWFVLLLTLVVIGPFALVLVLRHSIENCLHLANQENIEFQIHHSSVVILVLFTFWSSQKRAGPEEQLCTLARQPELARTLLWELAPPDPLPSD